MISQKQLFPRWCQQSCTDVCLWETSLAAGDPINFLWGEKTLGFRATVLCSTQSDGSLQRRTNNGTPHCWEEKNTQSKETVVESPHVFFSFSLKLSGWITHMYTHEALLGFMTSLLLISGDWLRRPGTVCSGLLSRENKDIFVSELATLRQPPPFKSILLCFVLLSNSFLIKKEFRHCFLLFAPRLTLYDLSVSEVEQIDECFLAFPSRSRSDSKEEKKKPVCTHVLKRTQCKES